MSADVNAAITGTLQPGKLLSAQGLSVLRGGRPVLTDVSLSAKAGQWLAVVGPNGAGKSTLLRCLAGLLTPVAGSVVWSQAVASPRLSWLGQETEGGEALSVRDTVALGRLPHQGWLGWPGESLADRNAIEQALVDTDMDWATDRSMQTLSGGERQRVRLARALAVQAPVLLLDEPVAHLDAPHQRLVAQVLQREASRGRCIISVLHELPLALVADCVAVMQSGRLVAHGARDDAVLHQAIEQVFDQAVRIALVQGQWAVLPQL